MIKRLKLRRKRTFDDYLYHFPRRMGQLGGIEHIDRAETIQGKENDLAILKARVEFEHDLELFVFEVVERTRDNGVHRLKYRYAINHKGRPAVRYDYEPIIHPELPHHMHRSDGTKVPSRRVRVEDVVEEMWADVRRQKREAAEGDLYREHTGRSA